MPQLVTKKYASLLKFKLITKSHPKSLNSIKVQYCGDWAVGWAWACFKQAKSAIQKLKAKFPDHFTSFLELKQNLKKTLFKIQAGITGPELIVSGKQKGNWFIHSDHKCFWKSQTSYGTIPLKDWHREWWAMSKARQLYLSFRLFVWTAFRWVENMVISKA